MEWQSNLQPKDLLDDVKRLNFFLDDTGVQMAQRQSKPIPQDTKYSFPFISAAIDEIARLLGKTACHYMVNKLPPICNVPVHTDSLRLNAEVGKIVLERWHLPILTNPLALYWDENMGVRPDGSYVGFHMKVGIWYGPIPYYMKHTIWNDHATEERIHLVVDLKD
jgi:hypothetical protein